MSMDILQFARDPQLAGSFLPGTTKRSWRNWFDALSCLYGLPIRDSNIVQTCTGRSPASMPTDGFREALFLCGRRAGKSSISALIACYEALFGPGRNKLSAGEEGIVLVVSPSRRQSRKVHDYCRALFNESPILKNEMLSEQREGFTLKPGNVRIEIGVADHRLIRGHTLLAAVADEICFVAHEMDGSGFKSDSALVAALRPSLASTNGPLIAISSPYGRSGWAYQTWKRCFGNDGSDILVWL